MARIFQFVALSLFIFPLASVAEEKKEPVPRSLIDDSAYLTEKSVKSGWTSEKVTVIQLDKKKGTRHLFMYFETDKGKPTGKVTLGANESVIDAKYELAEKDGKRSIKLVVSDPLFKQSVTLEYALSAGEMKLRGGLIRWVTDEVDFSQAIAFKAAK